MEDVMKTVIALMGIFAPAAACAAAGAGGENSGVFVWIFLGLCALIVVAQVIPAVLLMFGMAKGIKSVVKRETEPVRK
jgi:hypothetical protein